VAYCLRNVAKMKDKWNATESAKLSTSPTSLPPPFSPTQTRATANTNEYLSVLAFDTEIFNKQMSRDCAMKHEMFLTLKIIPNNMSV